MTTSIYWLYKSLISSIEKNFFYRKFILFSNFHIQFTKKTLNARQAEIKDFIDVSILMILESKISP